MNRSRAGATGVAVAVAAALVLGGCSGGTESTQSDGGSSGLARQGEAAVPQPLPADGKPTGEVAADAADGTPGRAGAASVDPAALAGRRQVRAGDLRIQVQDVPAAAARVRSLASAAKGFIADEKTSSDPAPTPVRQGETEVAPPRPDRGESVLTLRVPGVALDAVMDQVAGLGTLKSRGQSSTDVTGQYIDTASRLRTQRESVDRVRTLLSRATKLGEVVQIESELSRRQADLESLQAQLAALEDQTTLATLTVSLAPLAATPVTAPPQGAFVAGLRDGWDALLASVAVALTILGAVLPFVLLAAALVLPVLVLRRRRTQPSTST